MTAPVRDPEIGLEERLVVELVRSRLGVVGASRDASDADRVDAQRLVAVASAHGVLPLARRTLSEGLFPGVRADVRAVVDAAADQAARRSLAKSSTLLELLAKLSVAGVTAVPWKGPVLAEILWSDVAMRQYGDLDLLVRRADVDRARDVLLATGFRRIAPIPAWQEKRHIHRNGELELVRDEDGMVLEVHWTVVPSYYASAMDPEGLWNRLEEITIARRSILTLSAEDLLLSLSIHGFKHRWERLGWIVDVARLLQVRPRMDWEGLRRRTARDGSRRIVRVAVGVAGQMFGNAVTATAVEALGADSAADRIVQQIAPDVMGRVPDGRSHHTSALNARARERRRDRLAYYLSALTTTNRGDWATIPIPRQLAGAYRLIRPARLLARYVTRARRGA